MFGWIRNRFRKSEEEDYSDLRSTILNDRPFEPPKAFEQPKPFEAQQRGYEDFTPKTRDVFEPVQSPLPSFPSSYEEGNTSKNYDILDRLNLIESQIAAIRSMTETINERLKNMETRLGLQRRF